jgi:MoaA/NifB/PqqE/SkfB family radical SAM enzyme
MALRFNEWRKEKNLSDLSLCYAISHCADYPEIIDNVELNKSFGFSGFRYLQINGIRFKNESELTEYLRNARKAGVTNIDTTFYGLEEYHDKFAARKGDFEYLIDILNTAIKLDIVPEPTFVILEDNKDQIEELVTLLQKYINADGAIHGFLQDYRGNGENLESVRLLRQSYDNLPDVVKH